MVSSDAGAATGGGEGGDGWFRFLLGAIVSEIKGIAGRGTDRFLSIPLPVVRPGFLQSCLHKFLYGSFARFESLLHSVLYQ